MDLDRFGEDDEVGGRGGARRPVPMLQQLRRQPAVVDTCAGFQLPTGLTALVPVEGPARRLAHELARHQGRARVEVRRLRRVDVRQDRRHELVVQVNCRQGGEKHT
jgi:hypothetical protein